MIQSGVCRTKSETLKTGFLMTRLINETLRDETNKITCALGEVSEQRKHYENTPMQYTAIFQGCKNDNFQFYLFDYFHIFDQNIYCRYSLEPPIEAVLTSTHNICFRAKIRK